VIDDRPHRVNARPRSWLGSIGYELHPDHREFARHVRAAGVERLIDVREVPISRRRGYAKRALSAAMSEVGVEYVHLAQLGNPRPYRDLYKSGRIALGRRRYREHMLSECGQALGDLAVLVGEKRCALMCLEHDPARCHRSVIVDVLRDELGLALSVAEL
jgi:uncharacterized protein (DUF488 family)